MNYELIVWGILSISAAWYCLALLKRGASLVTNTAPLYDELRKRADKVRTQSELEHLQSIFIAANRAVRAGLIYSVLGVIGLVAVVTMTLVLVLL